MANEAVISDITQRIWQVNATIQQWDLDMAWILAFKEEYEGSVYDTFCKVYARETERLMWERSELIESLLWEQTSDMVEEVY